MKSIIIFLISSIILFYSCTKYEGSNSLPDQTRPPAANMTPGSLKGREFVFDSLEWIDNDFGYPTFYMVDSDLFMPGRHLSVAIKHDTLSVWEQANGYVWVGVLAVWPNPAQPALIGKRFSLKVKFL
jgi:hypothetical protein